MPGEMVPLVTDESLWVPAPPAEIAPAFVPGEPAAGGVCSGGASPRYPRGGGKPGGRSGLRIGGVKNPLGFRPPPLAPTRSLDDGVPGAFVKGAVGELEACKRRLAVEAPADVV